MTRTAMLAFALAGCAWFGLGIRQAHDLGAATSIIVQPNAPSAQQARHASALLNAAATLNPDQQIGVLRGELALAEGNEALARHYLYAVVRHEPNNLLAYVWYARASTHDPFAFFAAESKIAKLEPRLR